MRILGLTASALLLLTSGLGSLGCDGGAKPKLLPIAPQQVRVGTRLAVPLRVENGGGSRLEFDWVRLQLPQESLTVRITSTPFGGELIYEPLITHLAPDGSEIEREFVIVMKADGAEQRQSVVVKILPAEGTAPIFVSPGPGALVYTDRSAQLRVDIAIKDDDSDQVEISVEGGPPNAMLNQYGPKQATYEWALTPEQIEQPRDTWQVTFYATDHLTRTAHPFTITLRRAALNTCPGTRPEVRVVSPAADANIEGWTYEVRITVTDDVGLRDAPILQYSTTRPDDVTRPDPALFVPVEFEGKGTDALPYIARIRTLPLDLGQRATIWYYVSVTDNDDPTGPACDHTTETDVASFTATAPTTPPPPSPRCEPCGRSFQCTGACVQDARGPRCLERCSGPAGDTCAQGTCLGATTTEGTTARVCGTVSAVCDTTSTCTNDVQREPNDMQDRATRNASTIADGQICRDDVDLYRIDANPGDEITAELNFESSTGNLDLYIENSLGNTLVASESSNNNREMTTLCVSSAEPVFQFFVRVAGYRDAENAYALNVASRAGSCCVNGTTEGEPNNSIPTAHPLSVSLDFEGVACSRDSDYFRFAVATASQIEVVLLVTGGTLGASLFSQDGRALAIGRPDGPETIVIRHTTTAIGTYTVRVTGPTTGQARYLGMVTLTPRARTDCSRTSDCPDLGHVCAEASCRTVACTGANTGCPDGHLCTSGLCSLRCSDDGDCRPDERCKWGENGRACARDGNGADGTACSRAGDCSNASACILPLATAGPDAAIPAPIAGYCGRIRCATDSDCGAFPYQTCVGPAGGVGSCALDCGTNPDACAPALTCQDANSLERNRAERVCLP